MKFKFYLSDCTWYSERKKIYNIGGITFSGTGKDFGRPHEVTFEVDVKRPPKDMFAPIDGTYMRPDASNIVRRHRFEEFDNDKLCAYYIDKIEPIVDESQNVNEKFVKGKRLNYNQMSFRDLIIAYFAHWTNYATDGWPKTGTLKRLEDYLWKHFPVWREGYYDGGLHSKLMDIVVDICDWKNATSTAPYYVKKEMAVKWPKIEEFLETTPLIDDNVEEESKAISFNTLKKFVNEDENTAWVDKTWFGVPGTRFIWNGEWADPEVEYDGEIINSNELDDYVWTQYELECREKGKRPNEDEFQNKSTKWFKKQLDDFMFGRFGDVDESYDSKFSEFTDEEKVVVKSLDKISTQLDKLLSSTKFGSKNFQMNIQTALNSINNAKQNYMI